MKKVFTLVIFFFFSFLVFSALKTYSLLQTEKQENVILRRQLDSLAIQAGSLDFLAYHLPLHRLTKGERSLEFNKDRWTTLLVFLQDKECVTCFKDHLDLAKKIYQEIYPTFNFFCFENAFTEREISFLQRQEQTIIPFYSAKSFSELSSLNFTAPNNCAYLLVLLNSYGKIVHYRAFKYDQEFLIMNLVEKYKQLCKGE